MDLNVHSQVLWYACKEAERRLGDNKIGNPTAYYPYINCGSWVNDNNQSTIFTDFIGNKDKDAANSRFSVDGEIENLFETMWLVELKEDLRRMGKGSAIARSASSQFEALFPQATSEHDNATALFGQYCRFDHLDLLEAHKEEENKSWQSNPNAHVSESIVQTFKYMKNTFTFSSFEEDAEDRLSRDSVIALGKSLHTVGDFYAHSNYVELLLWGLADEGLLKENIIQEFNSKGKFPFHCDKIRPYCPLPTKDDNREKLLATSEEDNLIRILWYGEKPETTPLTPCLFLFKDTTYSLLMMYAMHLERVGSKPLDNDTLDMAMSIFNIPGQDVALKFFNVYEKFAGVLSGIGKMVRGFLVNSLREIGKTMDPATREIMEASAMIVENYNSAEAKEWAKAGRLKYVAYTLQKEMSTPLLSQTTDSLILPHHSLLHKDYMPGTLRDMLRFRLSTLFAVEATTELLMMHFAKESPGKEQFWSIAERYFVHPSTQIPNGNSRAQLMNMEQLNLWLNDAIIGDWMGLSSKGNVIRS